jgi:hypothetical protein
MSCPYKNSRSAREVFKQLVYSHSVCPSVTTNCSCGSDCDTIVTSDRQNYACFVCSYAIVASSSGSLYGTRILPLEILEIEIEKTKLIEVEGVLSLNELLSVVR